MRDIRFPTSSTVNPGDGITRSISANEVALGAIDAFRTDDLLIVDFRIEKEFAASGNTSLTFSIDGFNLFNEARGGLPCVAEPLTPTSAGNLNETLAPRILAFGCTSELAIGSQELFNLVPSAGGASLRLFLNEPQDRDGC